MGVTVTLSEEARAGRAVVDLRSEGAIPHGARFALPPDSEWVIPRPRLFARLAAKPTVAVIGAAGYGKSALIASWVARARPADAVAWLTLDRSDRDPRKLAADLLAALHPVAAAMSRPLADSLLRLHAPPAFAPPLAFVDAFHEALLDADVPVALVLDDVQEISASSTALEMIDRLMLWMPSQVTVVIASRGVPRLRLQRLRLQDKLELIGTKDLVFTLAETAQAAQAWELGADAPEVAAIHALTHGWPAGVRMAALARKGGKGTDLEQTLRRDDALADYLATEVLATLDPELRDFVLEATIDDRVCPSLVDAVRRSSDAAASLERCVRAGLFLTRDSGPGEEPWFRWHALFGAHMRARRRQKRRRSDELERRAAVWWRGVDAGTAVPHALAAHDAHLAADIASSSWLELVLAGRVETASRIVEDSFPGATDTAELHLARAFVAAERGAVDVARASLVAALGASSQLHGHARLQFDVRRLMIELYVVRDRAALAVSLTRGRALMREVQSASRPLDRATLALIQLCLGIGEARLLDHPLEAVRLLREARSAATDLGYTALRLTAEAELCIPSVATGDLETSRELAESTIAEATAMGWAELPSLAPAYGWLGWLALWRGQSRRARGLLEHCTSNLPPNDWGLLGLATTTHAQACLSSGDLEGAENDARRGRELASLDRMPPWWPSLLNALEATVLLARGRVDEARELAEKPTAGPQYHLATCYRAIVLLRAGRPDAALTTVQDFPPEQMYPHVAAVIDALRAQALFELGDTNGAHAAVENALARAAEHDLLEPFLMIRERISALLHDHAEAGTAYPNFVVRVRSRLRTPDPATVNDWGETLTVREQNILEYLATDLTLSEVAEAEFITVNTVKTHIAHIYDKLGARNRREAVRRAADLHVL